MNLLNRKWLCRLIVFLIAVSQAFVWNTWNCQELGHAAPNTLRQGVTVLTSDDASYLRPPENWLDGGVWRDNSTGVNAHYLRSPGYGLLYLPIVWVTGEGAAALQVFFWVQLLLFGLAALLFFEVLKMLKLRSWLIWLLTAVTFLTPWLAGFLNYTLTEAITPQLIMLGVFLAVYDRVHKPRWTLAAVGIWAGILMLVRPPLLPLAIIALPTISRAFKERRYFASGLFVMLSLLPWSLWTARNYSIAGSIPTVHPVYDNTSHSIFRSPHKALASTYKVWNADPALFHRHAQMLWSGAEADTGEFSIAERIVQEWPKAMRDHKELRDEIVNSLEAFRRSATELHEQTGRGEEILGLLPNEENAVWRNERLSERLANRYPIKMWITTPLKALDRMCVQSNLNLFIFQKVLRGNWLMEAFRGLFVLLQLTGWMAVLLILLHPGRRHGGQVVFWASVGALIYVVGVAAFQRMVEPRYVLPVIPLLTIALGVLADRLFELVQKR